jgi:16S rRNA processing protein RimM
MPGHIVLAAVAGAHGITGEVRLKLFGDGIETLSAHRQFNDGKLTLTKLKDDSKGGAIARFAEISDRNAAEALRGTTLEVPRAVLPPLAEGEYYYADLIGLPVSTQDGEPIGNVVAVENFGAGDVIEIERPGGARFMVPMRPEAVPEWNAECLVVAKDFVDI